MANQIIFDGTIEIDHVGTKRYLNRDDKRHRTDGPAVECADGTKYWYIDGKRHRTDGPAVEWSNGFKYWWIDDKEYSESDFRNKEIKRRQAQANPKPTCHGKTVQIDGKSYKLTLVD